MSVDHDTPYRADVDGLRALAVSAVILYHGFPSAFSGGFIGVDVFFVISGFLISANIFRRLDAGRFSFRDFYARRIRRIFPALFVVLTGCLAYGFVVLLPSELARLGKSIVGGAAFFSNLLLWREAGYFDQAAIAKPLLHLWSLGVEEQFYIVWPLALWLLYRGPRRSPIALLITGAMSLALSLVTIGSSKTADFYSPLTRLWELDAGAILAFAMLYSRTARIRKWRSRSFGRLPLADLLSLLGFTLILGSAVLMNRAMAFPGGLVLLPVAGSLMLIGAGPGALVNRTVLANRLAVFFGLISYPLYLWHWPLISFAYIIDHGRPLKAFLVLWLIVTSVVLAWLTYRFFECPLRFGSGRRRNTFISIVLMIAIGAAGLTAWSAQGFPARYPALPSLSVAKINAAIGDGIFKPTPGMYTRKVDGITVSRIGSGDRAVLFIGDSAIYQYGPRVQQLLNQNRLKETVYFVAGASCAPVPGVVRRDRFSFCNNLSSVAARLIDTRHIGTIVIGASWAGYQNGDISIVRDGIRREMSSQAGLAAFYANLEDEVARLMRTHHKVDIVLAPVTDQVFNPQSMIRRSVVGFKVNDNVLGGVPVNALEEANSTTNRRLSMIATATGAETLNPLPDVCGTGPRCSAFFGDGKPKFADHLHLRPEFVAHHIRIFDGILTDQ
jgi:peptidoglycan/LPS O-acetylase OafA/YrhL